MVVAWGNRVAMGSAAVKLMESENPEENPYAPLVDTDIRTTPRTSNIGRNFAIFLAVCYGLALIRVIVIASTAVSMSAASATRASILGSMIVCFTFLSLFSARQFKRQKPSARWWLAFSSLPFAIGVATVVWVLLVGV